MAKTANILFLLILTASSWAQPAPSSAIPDPQVGLPPAARGVLTGGVGYSSLSNDYWQDSRMKLGFSMGLTSSVGMTVSGSTRDLSGYGAFQRGPEDMRAGLSLWPLTLAKGQVRAGINANVMLPTGFRTQQLYYDSLGASQTMPAFSLKQSGGEMLAGASWLIGNVTELNLFGGLFSSSDRKEQSYQWGFNSWIAPFGPSVAAELGYAQTIARSGDLPTAQRFTSGLSLQLPWGIRFVPGFSADLSDDPLYGAGVELRFSRLLPKSLFPKSSRLPVEFQKRSGLALIAPPQCVDECADPAVLWSAMQGQMKRSFEETATLHSLDLPGFPFADNNLETFWHSVKGIAAEHPAANWLVIVTVEDEQIGPAKGVDVPLVVSKAQYRGQCHAHVRVVSLLDFSLLVDEFVSGISKRSSALQIEFVGSSDAYLSAANERTLMFDAYRDLSEKISYLIEEGELPLLETPIAIQE